MEKIANTFSMRKYLVVFAVFVLALVALLAGCDAQELGSLSDLSRPYAGVYKCEKITIGGKDMSETFSVFELELEGDGAFELRYETSWGGEGSYEGQYSVSEDKGEITFVAKRGARSEGYTFRMEKGAVLIDYNFLGRLLHAEFRMP